MVGDNWKNLGKCGVYSQTNRPPPAANWILLKS